jgi:regulator of protease activity HflC (stomatin/prohibitin superfamily)
MLSSGSGGTFARAIGLLFLAAVLALTAACSTSCVPTGHVGVITLFGRVTGRTISEGIHLVNPLANVTRLSVKTQEIKEQTSVPSKEGLIMGLEASVLYHLDATRASDVYQKFGPNYQAQQEAQRMEFVLQREKQEAERKRVEAAGIKDFQDIVTQGISEKLLEWKGIEATIELAKSQNSKVIVVGNSKTGLPLIYAADK